MSAGAAQVEPVQRHGVLRSTADGPDEQELVEREFAVVPVPACDMELFLDVGRGQRFAGGDALLDVGRIPGDRCHDGVEERLPRRIRPAAVQRIRRVLHDRREHMLARGRERLVAETRKRDLEHRLGRTLAVLGRVEGALDVVLIAGDENPLAVLVLCQARNFGQAIERAGRAVAEHVVDELKKQQLPEGAICFEITETAAIASYTQANRFIHALRELGCKFALDDFGTGLSSFGYLKHFPVDFLKIDGSFVRLMLQDAIYQSIVEAINKIGHVAGIQTIAEFVEDDIVIEKLKEIGVDYAQGFGIAKPQPIDNLLNGSVSERRQA